MRVGYGYDVHRFAAGRRLVLGGVEIPFEWGLQGHSDADVLTHAVIDALLGAAAAGDIGTLFPDTNSRYKDADSMDLLDRAGALVLERGWQIANVDVTVVAEAPRLSSYTDAMRGRLCQVLGLTADRLSIKATTSEKMGFAGRQEGMQAMAVCLLQGVEDFKD